jgi:thiamine pyrophosphate-dependent acetolactate synthase large subunit-like protein
VDDRPALVHVRTSPEENCYPMWPAGQSIDSMVVSDPRKKS